jgi:leucyl/phenylalanyl-tRNA--protein transferase
MQKETRQELMPEYLLRAYAAGYFPMAESRGGPVRWHSPDPRAIIPLDQLKISRSLRQSMRRPHMVVRCDTDFRQVMLGCAAREETWISEEIIEAYTRLFVLGAAHSVECWQDERLVGGLYGVAMGGAFFGESMYSLVTNASKIALVYLVRRLTKQGFILLDTQFLTPHLASLGACEIPRQDYLSLLYDALDVRASFTGEPLQV